MVFNMVLMLHNRVDMDIIFVMSAHMVLMIAMAVQYGSKWFRYLL